VVKKIGGKVPQENKRRLGGKPGKGFLRGNSVGRQNAEKVERVRETVQGLIRKKRRNCPEKKGPSRVGIEMKLGKSLKEVKSNHPRGPEKKGGSSRPTAWVTKNTSIMSEPSGREHRRVFTFQVLLGGGGGESEVSQPSK